MIRVLLIGDVRLSREGIADLLRRDGRVAVTATATSEEAVAAKTQDADVVVIDTTGGHGLTAAEVVAAADTPVVVFGLAEGTETAVAFAERGVIGFVDRESGVDELVAGIQATARREAWCPPPIAMTLLKRIREVSAEHVVSRDRSPLTAREHQIVELIAEGLTNKEIARRLCIEIATVKNHVHNILDKLQVRRRADAAARLRIVEAGSARHVAPAEGYTAQPDVA